MNSFETKSLMPWPKDSWEWGPYAKGNLNESLKELKHTLSDQDLQKKILNTKARSSLCNWPQGLATTGQSPCPWLWCPLPTLPYDPWHRMCPTMKLPGLGRHVRLAARQTPEELEDGPARQHHLQRWNLKSTPRSDQISPDCQQQEFHLLWGGWKGLNCSNKCSNQCGNATKPAFFVPPSPGPSYSQEWAVLSWFNPPFFHGERIRS